MKRLLLVLATSATLQTTPLLGQTLADVARQERARQASLAPIPARPATTASPRREAGRALLSRVIDGLGGQARINAIRSVRARR